LSLLWSSNVTIETFKDNDYIFLLLIPILYTSIKKEWTQNIITAFLIGIFISEVCSYGIYFQWWIMKHGTPSDPTPFMNHIEYSVFLAFTSVLLLSRLFSKHFTKKEKLFIVPFFLTVTGNLFLTGGRTGQIALLLGIIVLFILYYKISFKSILFSIVTIILIYFSAYIISDTFKNRVLRSINEINTIIKNHDLTTSIGIRATYYIIVKDIINENPVYMLFGVGSNDSFKEIHKVLNINMKYGIYYKNFKVKEEFLRKSGTHTQFLQIFLELGIIGLFLFIYLLYLIVNSKYYSYEIKTIAILFSLIFSVSLLSDILLELQFTRTLFILFITLFIINIKKEDK